MVFKQHKLEYMAYYFKSESVSEGHPDKVADQISDALLDNFLALDPHSKVACETLVTTRHVVLAGEVKSNTYVPSFVTSNSSTNQTLAQIELWKNYKNKVYMLPKHLVEKVVALHLEKLDAEITELKQDQAEYIGIAITGPFKHEYYRY